MIDEIDLLAAEGIVAKIAKREIGATRLHACNKLLERRFGIFGLHTKYIGHLVEKIDLVSGPFGCAGFEVGMRRVDRRGLYFDDAGVAVLCRQKRPCSLRRVLRRSWRHKNGQQGERKGRTPGDLCEHAHGFSTIAAGGIRRFGRPGCHPDQDDLKEIRPCGRCAAQKTPAVRCRPR